MTGRQKSAPSRITIERTANGGHVVEHHFDNTGAGESYRQPEKHAFSTHDELMSHIRKHTGAADVQEGEPARTGAGHPTTAKAPGPKTYGAGVD